MHVINARGANDALAEGIDYLINEGVHEDSRNGPVIVAPGPVCTVYNQPRERVLFSPTRDANPFFHLLGDALWCLSGSDNIAWPSSFNKRYGDYSDDGITQHGAYGKRWRWHFKVRAAHDIDQIKQIIDELTEKPESRQAVLTMWDPSVDLRRSGKDVPCNTQVYFDRRGGKLNMTVLCRSNDIIWGAYGANVVQFSILQEYIAAGLGIPVGTYRQFSNNFHVYTNVYNEEKLRNIADESSQAYRRYLELPGDPSNPLVEGDFANWKPDLTKFMAGTRQPSAFSDGFFRDTALPMLFAWNSHKAQRYDEALAHADNIASPDWRWACEEWLQRRKANKEVKDGQL